MGTRVDWMVVKSTSLLAVLVLTASLISAYSSAQRLVGQQPSYGSDVSSILERHGVFAVDSSDSQETTPLTNETQAPCTRLWTSVGDAQVSSEFGGTVSSAGDVNGDGFADVLVGAYYYDTPETLDAGKAYLYLGSPDGIATAPSWTSVGDNSYQAYFGASMTWGDLNQDGFDDVVIGAPGHLVTVSWSPTRIGKIFAFLGGPDGLQKEPAWTIEGRLLFENWFGARLHIPGDVDGDGYPDLVVSEGRRYHVRLLLYSGGPEGPKPAPSWHFDSEGKYDAMLGESLSSGDVNRDRFTDLVASDPLYTTNALPVNHVGKVYLFLGGPLGWSAMPSLTWTGTEFRGLFGRDTASGGDLNEDGYDDVVIAGHRLPAIANRVFNQVDFHPGEAAGVAPNATWSTAGPSEPVFLGYGLALNGDANGDGTEDLLIGAPGHNESGIREAGKLFLHLGDVGGLNTMPTEELLGDPEPFGHFGWTVAYAGNVDGRPGDEILVGHRSFWVNAQTVGKAYLFSCGAPHDYHVTFRLTPETLNLKSKGRWVSAHVTLEGATTAEVDLGSLELNGVPAARAKTLNDTAILAKFDHAAVAGTLPEGKAVTLTLTGQWRDGRSFTATDAIRVIRQGR